MEFDFMQQPGLVKKKAICDEIVKPLVSIITPYYNGSRYFEQTFNCVINQTFTWFEWIIVDDGSKEEEYMYLKNIVQNDTRIKIYTKKNGGPASARNFAIKCASTDIVVSLDADDLICPISSSPKLRHFHRLRPPSSLPVCFTTASAASW